MECLANPVPYNRYWQSNCPTEEFSEDEAESFEGKCTFLSLFHFLSDDFDVDSHDFELDTLRNKTNVKESLHKYLEHWHHIGVNPSDIDAIENG